MRTNNSSDRVFLGIDGGGTQTTAVLFDENGRFLAQSVSGSINTNSNTIDAVRRNLKDLIQEIGTKAHRSRFTSVFIGSSALNTAATERQLHDLTDGIIEADSIGMDSDLFIALQAMDCPGSCAVAICGTGSMAVGRNKNGQVFYKGGYGHLLGDEGSGYAIALSALRAAIRGSEGSAEETTLEDAARRHFAVADMNGLIAVCYDPPISRQEIAAFLPDVCRCAENGDAVARRILQTQAEDFAHTVRSLLPHLESGCPIGVWGGVFRHVPIFTAAFRASIPESPVALLRYPPQLGAVFAAFRQANVPLTSKIREAMAASYPDRM